MSNDLEILEDIDFLTKVDEHKKLFPLADLQGQVMKLDEELDEYLKATTIEEKIKELADCIICCIGIFRWATLVSRSYLAFIYSRMDKSQYKDIIKEVNNKWQINLNRTWEYKDGKYHHV